MTARAILVKMLERTLILVFCTKKDFTYIREQSELVHFVTRTYLFVNIMHFCSH